MSLTSSEVGSGVGVEVIRIVATPRAGGSDGGAVGLRDGGEVGIIVGAAVCGDAGIGLGEGVTVGARVGACVGVGIGTGVARTAFATARGGGGIAGPGDG